jgi:membrane protein
MVRVISATVSLVRKVIAKWRRDKAELLAASLAYYSVFSLAPLVMLAVAISSLRAGAEESRRFMIEVASGFVGQRGAEALRPMIESAGRGRPRSA